MKMPVNDRLVTVCMSMRFAAIPFEFVYVLVMSIVAVPMRVLDYFVGMLVLVMFTEMQPNTEYHQCGSNAQLQGDRVAKKGD